MQKKLARGDQFTCLRACVDSGYGLTSVGLNDGSLNQKLELAIVFFKAGEGRINFEAVTNFDTSVDCVGDQLFSPCAGLIPNMVSSKQTPSTTVEGSKTEA